MADTDKFPYMTGKEISEMRKQRQDMVSDIAFAELILKITVLWKKGKVEQQLIEKGNAVLAETLNVLPEKDIKNWLLDFNKPVYNKVYYPRYWRDRYWGNILKKHFEIDYDAFEKFCNENSFYWKILTKATAIYRPNIFHKPKMTACSYQLIIRLAEMEIRV